MLGHVKDACRQLLRFIGVLIYQCGLASWVIGRSQRTRAVLYHAVENTCSSYTKGLDINVTPEIFALHLKYYQRFYKVVSMEDFLKRQSAISTVKKDAMARAQLLITFDDGYSSVLEEALPLLEAHNMPATTYLIGNAVRGRMVWVNRLNQALNDYPSEAREVLNSYQGLVNLSRRGIIYHIQMNFAPQQIEALINQLESTIPQLTAESVKLFCTPDDIREMQGRGMEFGFHSNDHWNLGQCKDRELAATLVTDGLDQLINSNTFAYPFGYFSASSIGRLTRLGYGKLMTVGNNNDKFSSLHLDRIEMFETSFAGLFAKLEIEEPVMSTTRRWYGKFMSRTKGLISRGEKRAA